MTKEDREAAFAAIIEDPEALFASIREDLRRTNPEMTEEQHDWSEGYARFVLGFPKLEPTRPEDEGSAEPTSAQAATVARGSGR